MIGVIFNMDIKSPSIYPKTNGIYKITNIKTGRFYIGKAEGKMGFYGRWRSHRLNLRKNTHHCSYLQSSYNKHGEPCFTFEILEIKDYGEPLTCLESEYIVNLEAMHFQKGYNIKNEKSATQPTKIVRENHPNSKDFELLDREGNLVKRKNLSQFCQESGLGERNVRKLLRGLLKSYRGYKSTNPDFHRVGKEYRLMSSDKELIVFDSMAEFAKKIGVSIGSVSAVLKGIMSNVKGYHLENPSPKYQKNIDRLVNKKVLINKSLGIIIRFVSISKFSLEYRIPSTTLFHFFTGEKNYLTEKYNWTIPTQEDIQLYPIIDKTF